MQCMAAPSSPSARRGPAAGVCRWQVVGLLDMSFECLQPILSGALALTAFMLSQAIAQFDGRRAGGWCFPRHYGNDLTLVNSGSPSMTAASESNLSQTMPARSAASKMRARSASAGLR